MARIVILMLKNREHIKSLSIGEQKHHQLQMQILGLLYQGIAMTASALSKRLNLSVPTIRTLLDELIALNIVFQDGDMRRVGRKPFFYSLKRDAFYVFSIEVGHSNSRCAIIDSHNQVVGNQKCLSVVMDDDNFYLELYRAFQSMTDDLGLEVNRFEAVGISMPGLIDSERGINHSILTESGRDVRGNFQKYFQLPVFVENDARMNTLGELEFGAGRGKQNVLVINWNKGIGLGMVADGHLVKGNDGFAGELSHIRIVPDGELCRCGKCGCLQTIASTTFLLNLAYKAISENRVSCLTSQFSDCAEKLEVTDIIDAAQKGDELALSLLCQISENLAWGLSILIQLNNPELIVINGPLAKAGELVRMPLLLSLNQYCLRDISSQIRLVISSREDGHGLSGVAVMVFNKLFGIN